MRTALLAASLLALAACGEPADPTATASTEAPATPAADGAPAITQVKGDPLPARLNCLRDSGGVLVIGHRGGPTRDYPENAVETLQRTFDAGARAMEIDIAETKDGHLILMHDDDLDRTTTGTGLVADHTLAEIQSLKLRAGGKETTFTPPTLQQALEWAVKTGAVVELDKKRSAQYGPIIDAVRAARAENNVFVITYTDEQAAEVHALAPDLVITATVNSTEQLDRLIASGVKPATLLAWTGNVEPRPELWSALAARGIESIFGTNGSRAEGLDYKYWDDDDGSEFDTLAADGLPILVTGYSDKVGRQLRSFTAKAASCGL
jgi:glycerophosphoryl diester phosphodiesterase